MVTVDLSFLNFLLRQLFQIIVQLRLTPSVIYASCSLLKTSTKWCPGSVSTVPSSSAKLFSTKTHIDFATFAEPTDYLSDLLKNLTVNEIERYGILPP